jgi:biotin carboxylase
MLMVECILDKKTLLIISGGIEAVPGIQLAREIGLHLVVSDMNKDAPGFAFSDDHIVASTYDIEATVKAAKEYNMRSRPIDGVICIAADVPLTVAAVAKELGLPGISIETAYLAINKLAMKQCFISADIPVPWFCLVESVKDLTKIIRDKGLPIIIKPVDSRGARGVLRIMQANQAEWAFRTSISHSPSSKLIVEEFLEGPQISTEAVIINGVGYPVGFTDRNYEFIDRFAPYIIENGGGFPSNLKNDDQKLVTDTAIKAGLAMGITDGVSKGDMVLTDEGPKVIEIAPRLSGGWFSTDQIPIGLGVDLVGSAIKIALGEQVERSELKPKYHKGIAVRYFFPEPGRVVRIENAEQFRDRSWVHKLGFFVKPGDIVEPVTNHTKRAGFVITMGETRDQAVERAMQVVESIKIETVPVK